MGPTRTLAFQVSEDLFQRLKNYLRKTNIKQKDFVVGLIEHELERFEMSEKEQSQGSGAEEGEMGEQQDTDGPYAIAEPQEDAPVGSQRDEEGPDENAAENQRGGEEWTGEKKTGADEPCDDEGVDEDGDMEMKMVPVL